MSGGTWLLCAMSVATRAAPLAVPEVSRHTLDNGLELLLSPDPGASVVALSIGHHMGRGTEPPDHRGWSHLIGHLLYAGTEAEPSLFSDLESLGWTFRTTSSAERTTLSVLAPSEQLPFLLHIEADRHRAGLAFVSAADLARERERVVNEGAHRPPDQVRLWQEVLETLHGAEHPLAAPFEDPDLLAGADLDAVRTYYRRTFGPDRMTVVIAGGFDPDAALAMARASLSRIPLREIPGTPMRPATPTRLDRTRTVQVPASGQAQIVMAWPLPVLFSRGYGELEVAASLLQGPDGRLARALVEPGMSTYATASTAGNIGAFLVMADVGPGHTAAEVITALDDAVWALFNDEKPTDAEVERARRQVLTRTYEALAGPDHRANLIADLVTRSGDPDAARPYLARFGEATPRDVLERAWEVVGAPHVVVEAVVDPAPAP